MNFTHKHPPLSDNHSATECLLRWLSQTLTLLQTMSRVRWVDNGQDCSSMCLMNYRLLQTLGKSKIQLLNPLIIENLSVTPWLMTDTTHLMASEKADRNFSSLFSFITRLEAPSQVLLTSFLAWVYILIGKGGTTGRGRESHTQI